MDGQTDIQRTEEQIDRKIRQKHKWMDKQIDGSAKRERETDGCHLSKDESQDFPLVQKMKSVQNGH